VKAEPEVGEQAGWKENPMIAMDARKSDRAARVRTLPKALRTLTRCLVCGSREVRTDEVLERGILLLHECPRCEHRWTDAPLRVPAPASAAAEIAAA
jgi:hypothetical protein